MSNLTKRESVNLPKEVSSQSKSVYLANLSTPIRNISDMNVIVNSIHQSINRTIADKGVNMIKEDINYLYESVREDILKDFSTLSLEDIRLCFNMGVRGKLGEYFGINAVTLYQWLHKYKEEILPQTFKEVYKHLPPAKIEEPKIDFKQLDLEKIETICQLINKYKNDSIYDFNDFGNIHYKFLEKNNILNFTEEEKELCRENSRNLILSEAKTKNLELISQGRNIQMIDINKLMEKIEFGDKDIDSAIEINYLKLLFKHFITNFSRKEKDLQKFRNDLIDKIELQYGK
jgi:hypothetical protein